MSKSADLPPRNHKSIMLLFGIVIMISTQSFKSSELEIKQVIKISKEKVLFESDTINRGSIPPAIKTSLKRRQEILEENAEKIPMEDKPSGKDSYGQDYYDIVATPSMPNGGLEGWSQYLSSNLKYPEEAREKGISGTVIATFLVNNEGNLYDIEILRGIGGGCDEELLRVLKNSPTWTPGKLRTGEAVNTKQRMPVKFQ